MADGAPQDVLQFREMSPGFELSEGAVIFYPGIVCDISSPISKDVQALKALSVYSTNTGTAAGVGIADALLHGLNEVIERDAESKFLLDINVGVDSFKSVALPAGPWKDYFDEVAGGYGNGGALLLLESVAGYVFCAVAPSIGDEAQLGFGSSQYPDVAIVRALTELRQCQIATERGVTWLDEGGVPLSNLSGYPNMVKVASRQFNVPHSAEIGLDEVPLLRKYASRNPVLQLQERGFVPYGRLLWSELVGEHMICVAQALVPGLENFAGIVLGRPMVPVGRCRSDEVMSFLLAR